MNEELTKLEKIQEFLNDEDNGVILRIGMVVIGLVLGVILVLLSALFQDKTLSTTFLVCGCVTVGGFMLGAGIWGLMLASDY